MSIKVTKHFGEAKYPEEKFEMNTPRECVPSAHTLKIHGEVFKQKSVNGADMGSMVLYDMKAVGRIWHG